jgi:hypothetical protein
MISSIISASECQCHRKNQDTQEIIAAEDQISSGFPRSGAQFPRTRLMPPESNFSILCLSLKRCMMLQTPIVACDRRLCDDGLCKRLTPKLNETPFVGYLSKCAGDCISTFSSYRKAGQWGAIISDSEFLIGIGRVVPVSKTILRNLNGFDAADVRHRVNSNLSQRRHLHREISLN